MQTRFHKDVLVHVTYMVQKISTSSSCTPSLVPAGILNAAMGYIYPVAPTASPSQDMSAHLSSKKNVHFPLKYVHKIAILTHTGC